MHHLRRLLLGLLAGRLRSELPWSGRAEPGLLPDGRRARRGARAANAGGRRPARCLALPPAFRVYSGLSEEPDPDPRHQEAQTGRAAPDRGTVIVDVAVLPSAVLEVERKVAIVVDALRASSTIIAMFEAGDGAVVVAADPDDAFAIVGEERERYLICGESGGLPPAGFDYGNSPRQIAALDLAGRMIVLSTSNGTRALRAV